jgi:hypothetical protein
MSAFESFMTGFLGRSADIIGERKDKAEDYFDTRLERARTIGVDNIRARREQATGMLTLSRNLMQNANMPEHVVRALANEGPQALEQAHQIYMESMNNGVSVDEGFWDQTYNFSQEVLQDSNMSLTDFLDQVVGLYPSNLQATTREGGDPFGAFVASGLGLNAMDRARDRLGDYEVAEGFSAADILSLDGRPQNTRPLGDTGFAGPNYTFISDTWQENAPAGPLSEVQIKSFYDLFDSRVEEEATRLYQAFINSTDNTRESTRGVTVETYKEEARRLVAAEMAERYPSGVIAQLPVVASYLTFDDFTGQDDPDEITTTVLPPSTNDLVDAGIGQERGSAVQPGDQLTDNTTGETYTIKGQTEDGVVVEDSFGQEQVLSVDEVVQGLESGGMGYSNTPRNQPTTSEHLSDPDLPAPGQQIFTTLPDEPSKTYTFTMYVDGNLVFRDDESGEYQIMTPEDYKTSLESGQVSRPVDGNPFGLGAMSPPLTGPQIQDDW